MTKALFDDRYLPWFLSEPGINEWLDSLALDYAIADAGYFADRAEHRAAVSGALPSEL